jgi:hypothetical protein
MEWFPALSPEMQRWLLDFAAKTTTGLAAKLTLAVVEKLGARARRRFAGNARQEALSRALAEALAAGLRALPLDAESGLAEHYRQMFEDWLAREPVVEELTLLLEPSGGTELDRDLLRAEFEAGGYDPEWLGSVDFDVLLDLLVGGFTAAAQKQDDLIEPLKLNLLRDMAQRMGALDRLEDVAHNQLRAACMTASSLGRIEALAQELVDGQDVANTLLADTPSILMNALQDQNAAHRQEVYAVVRDALDKAQKHSTERLDTGRIEALLEDIRNTLSGIEDTITAQELVQMETNYRKRVVEQFETLTFKGISPSGRPIALKLRDIYVELKAVAEVPEAADTFSADERRLLLEAEDRGNDARADMLVHLDALRLQRWKEEARRKQDRQQPLQRCSIHQTLADINQRGVVILGDPGSGKTTLLQFLALSQAEGTGPVADLCATCRLR